MNTSVIRRCAAALLLAGAARADVIFVNQSASGVATGLSWTDAFPNLADALTVSQSGDEIWIAAGVYRPSLGPDPLTFPNFFSLRPGVTLYGGFKGDEQFLFQRNPSLNPTRLARAVTPVDDPQFTGGRVAVAQGFFTPATLDGLIIEATLTDRDGYGSGELILVDSASLVMRDCVVQRGDPGLRIVDGAFIEMTGSTISACTNSGVALAQSEMSLDMCSVVECSAERGGAVHMVDSVLRILQSNFGVNRTTAYNVDKFPPDLAGAGGAGGAIYARDSVLTCDLSVFNSNFTSNNGQAAPDGGEVALGSGPGGAIFAESSETTIRDTIFADNFTGHAAISAGCVCPPIPAGAGGALCVQGGSALLERVRFANNEAGRSGSTVSSSAEWQAGEAGSGGALAALGAAVQMYGGELDGNFTGGPAQPVNLGGNGAGGALVVWSSSVRVRDCFFRDNGIPGQPDPAALGGVAVAVRGDGAMADLENCLIIRNIGGSGIPGGALSVGAGASARLTLSTVTENAASTGGGAFEAAGGILIVRSSIFWDNESNGVGGEAGQLGGQPDVAYCDVEGWTGQLGGRGNFSADPRFVGPADYRLLPTSPCIDAGDNTSVPPDVDLDFEGNPRRVDAPTVPDTGAGEPPVVDLGPFEFQGSVVSCPGDLNGDGVLNQADLEILLIAFGLTAGGDIDIDGDTDDADLGLLLDDYGASCD